MTKTKTPLEPQPLQAWFRANLQRDELIYKGAGEKQIMFMRDDFSWRLYSTPENWENGPKLISTHTSKSVLLPVYYYETDMGIKLICRGNFYDWKISVMSDVPVPFNFGSLFDRDTVESSSCCEGFPKDYIFGSYNQNPFEFTFSVGRNYDMMIFAFLLREGWQDRMGRPLKEKN